MTVAELIDKLREYPQDAIVTVMTDIFFGDTGEVNDLELVDDNKELVLRNY